MNRWFELLFLPVAGFIARLEVDSFLRRGHNKRQEELLEKILEETQKQTRLLEEKENIIIG